MLDNHLKGTEIKTLVPLSKLTTWKIGGPAQFLGEPKNINEVLQLISWSKESRVKYQIIGAGSNLLISDNGLKGLTISMRKLQGNEINSKNGIVEALAGEPIPNLAKKVAKQGLHGLEWSVGIPGTVGGATVMNAGAQDSCIADRLISVKVLSLKKDKIYVLKKRDLEFSYRNSILQKENLIVLSACFKLEAGHNPKKVLDLTSHNMNHRLETQPYHLPSCGSVFRNPNKLKAGRIIEELGLKGFQKGGVQISNIHANFIVNNGKGTAEDILSLISLIQKKVYEKHGFLLHTEVKQLGFE